MQSPKPCKPNKRPALRHSLSSLAARDAGQWASCERGYTLVALLAVMTIILLLISAAAPSIRQQVQRSREEEAIARGEEVAEAIRLYVRVKGALPTSIDQLLEGLPSGTKKVQILRPSAARDPLSSSGEWKTVKQRDPALVPFARAVTVYAGGRTPGTSDQPFLNIAGQPPTLINVLNTDQSEEAPGGEDTSESSSGPFVGVVSRSRRAAVITYYGIERHDQWLFTPYFR
ncbi:MAG TPA: type II secretion system protein [Pyrinomonadaceae bacterium]|nr:type II secretion system protein [Pyrinomonadaceae bacterium]